MALLGKNGGLIGARRVPSASSASGVWTLAEQILAQRVGLWPVPDPTPGLSPILWWDFSDDTTVSLSGSEITAISSKGSRNWTLTKSTTGPQYVTGINGRKCLDWGSSGAHQNFMRTTDTTSTVIGEVYVVVDASFGGSVGGSGYGGLLTGTGGASWYVLATTGDLAVSGAPFDTLNINGGTSNRFNSLFTSPSIDNPALLRIVHSGGSTLTATDGFEIGNDRSNFSLNRGWSGLVGEYIAFSSPLSTQNRTTLQAWLAGKWGITLS